MLELEQTTNDNETYSWQIFIFLKKGYCSRCSGYSQKSMHTINLFANPSSLLLYVVFTERLMGFNLI